MTRTSLHALGLSIVFCIAAAAGASLPQDRPFYATIRTGTAGDRCLGYGGDEPHPSRSDKATHCRPAWRFTPLGNDVFSIAHASSTGERCLIFSGNGRDVHPSRHNWDVGEYCGFPGGEEALLHNRQGVFHLVDLGDGRYTMGNASSGVEQCVIFSNNGTDLHPSRHNWGAGEYCGFPGGKDELLRNGQAIFHIAPAAGGDVLDVLAAHLYRADGGRSMGLTYSLTSDNQLRDHWLLQMPDIWGQEAPAGPVPSARNIVNHIRDLIAGAQQHVDLVTMVPFPSGEFQTAVREGLEQLAASGRPVTVRILGGWPAGDLTSASQDAYLRSLIANIKERSRYPNNRLKISVAAHRRYGLVWNHAKVLAVDGREMLIGGENFWDDQYLRENPVHDVSLRVRGSSAALAHHFADELWKETCAYHTVLWKPALWSGGSEVTAGCLQRPDLQTPPPAGNVRMLMVGRFGIDRRYVVEASEAAAWAAFENTSGPLMISQQDFMGTSFWNWSTPVMAAVVRSDRSVYLVVGDDHARAGPGSGSTYKLPLRTLNVLALELWETAKALRGTMTAEQLKERLCSRLSIAPMRFGPSKKWPGGLAFANHAKFWMSGDLFYVGSHNLYPAGLGELGAIVHNATHAAEVRAQYWDKLWTWSKADAISGSEATQPCVFRSALFL